MADRTYISIYAHEDFCGDVLKRTYMNLPWNHDKVWKKARRLMEETGGRSFALFEFKTGRNWTEER